MKTIEIREAWKSKLDKAAAEWQAGSARTKFKSTVLALLLSQREMPEEGKKRCLGKPCVSVPSKWLRSIYAENKSRIKFAKVCSAYGLMEKDGSWISQSFASEIGERARSDRWHWTEPESYGPMVEEAFDTSTGLCAKYADWLSNADGLKWGVDEFRGRWAVEAFNCGEIGWKDYAGLGIVAKVVLEKGFDDAKGHLFREYTPLTMCPKHLRGRCFVRTSTGDGMDEFFDLNGAFFSMSRLGAGLRGVDWRYGGMRDVEYKQMREGIKWGTEDIYKRICEKVKGLDPGHDYYGKWEDSRKKLKDDVQHCFNEPLSKLDEWEAAYTYTTAGVRWWDVRRRRWLVWKAMGMVDRYAWTVALRCKVNDAVHGRTGSFFTVAAAGEKCFFGLVAELLSGKGYDVHRLHDAIWTSDRRLLALPKRERERMVGELLQEWEVGLGRDPDYEANRRKSDTDPTKDARWIVHRMGKRLTEDEWKALYAALDLGRKGLAEFRRRYDARKSTIDRPPDALN